jgi:hypothetical protein
VRVSPAVQLWFVPSILAACDPSLSEKSVRTDPIMRTFASTTQVNAAAISPLKHHVRATVNVVTPFTSNYRSLLVALLTSLVASHAITALFLCSLVRLTRRLCVTSPQVIASGGQKAIDVAVAGGTGKFETRFYQMATEREIFRVKGHFGPVHTLAFHPNGLRYARTCTARVKRLNRELGACEGTWLAICLCVRVCVCV